MHIGIVGIRGRVGRLLVDEVRRQGASLVGGTIRPGSTPTNPDPDIRLFDSLDALAMQAKVVVDFTHADATAGHASILADLGSAWVLGTTGLSPRAQQAVELAARHIPVVQAANFAPGMTLVLSLAARMAAALPADEYDAEILEMHHRQKLDAPSGTALAIGAVVAASRGQHPPVHESGRHGQTGARKPGAIGFAALRGGQIVGEHTLLFTAGNEQITLSHRAFDRRVFAAGAIRAAIWTGGRPPGLYSLEDVLGLR